MSEAPLLPNGCSFGAVPAGFSCALPGAPEYEACELDGLIAKFPRNAHAVYCAGTLLALGVHTAQAGDARASMALFVREEHRMCGIGSALVRLMLTEMEACGVDTAYCDHDANADFSGFLNGMGLHEKYRAFRMVYRGGPKQVFLRFSTYTDSMYKEVHRLTSNAFLPMRRRLGINPTVEPPSTAQRREFAARADDFFVYIRNDHIIAAGSAAHGELDGLCVDVSCRRQGIGGQLAGHGINKLLHEGAAEIYLWAVTANTDAVRLYTHMGFETTRTHIFYTKELSN